MKEWRTVHDSRITRPPELDETSSATTVYERRNIRQEAVVDAMGENTEPVMQWVYEQREYTREEWETMNSPATKTIMQAISGLELSVALLALGGGETA